MTAVDDDPFGRAPSPFVEPLAGSVESVPTDGGMDDDADRPGLLFAWETPDGSRVTAIRIPDSYGNASGFGRWIESSHPGRAREWAIRGARRARRKRS